MLLSLSRASVSALLFSLLLLSAPATPAAADDVPGASLYDGCSWTPADLDLGGGIHMSFRYQTCEDEDMKVSYRAEDGAIVEDGAGGPYPVMRVWPLAGAAPDEFLTGLLGKENPPDASRCKPNSVPSSDYGLSNVWELVPNEAYRKELDATEEPWSACGRYGLSNDSVQFFRVIGRAMVFFSVGQEPPFFDVGSVTVTQP